MLTGLIGVPDARLLVVVAHPDDETFGCGSLLLRAAAEGVTTAVCCATRGEAGETAPGTDVPHGDLGRVRELELREAARRLHVTEVDLLGYGDSGMSGEAAPDALALADPEQLRDAVDAVVAQFRPDVLVTLDGSDGHRDHVAIRDATLAVAEARGLPAYLQCLSRGLMQRWVAHTMREQPESKYLALGELGTPDEEIDLVLDQSAFLEEREHAIAAHRSQVSPFEGLPPDLRRAFLGEDHLRQVG